MKKIFLIDGDNNINLGLRGIEMLAEDNHVMIFHSKAMEITKFKKKLAGCRAHIEFIESVRSGKNSLDFQITTELGFLSHHKELECAYIISCDKGYDAAVDYVKSRYSAKFKELDRRESIFDCFQLAFALKAKTKNELSSALVKEYGPEHGLLVYNHLKSIFGDVAEEAAPEVKTDAKLMEKAEKTVAEVQEKVKKTVKKVKTKAKPEATAPAAVVVDVTEPAEMIFSTDEILVEEEAPKAETAAKAEKKANKDRRKTRPERKPKVAKARTKKVLKPEAVVKEEPTKLDAAAEVVVEKVETLKGYDIPLRFGAVRTDEQNKSFYKSKDLRKKTKPQEETVVVEAKAEEAPVAEAEVKVEPEHVEAVVEMIQEKRPQRSGDRRSSNRGRDGQRRPRRPDGKPSSPKREPAPEGKVVPMKPRREERENRDVQIKARPKQEAVETTKPAAVKSEPVKPAAVKSEAPAQKSAAAAPVKKASGQNNPGFFGRMFGKKKK